MQAVEVSKVSSDGEVLRHWLNFSVSRGDYNNVKRRLVEECLIKPHILNNWIYGLSRIPEAGKRDINRVTMEISGKEIFTVAKPEGSSGGVGGTSSGEAI